MKRDLSTPLLHLLNERKVWEWQGAYVLPQYTPQQEASNSALASAWGDANKSDPWASARARLHLKQGYLLPSELGKDLASLAKGNRHETSEAKKAA